MWVLRPDSIQGVRTVSKENKSVFETNFYKLPWYHKLWATVPFFALKGSNFVLQRLIEMMEGGSDVRDRW